MPSLAFQEARDREIREGAVPVESIAAGKNVYVLIRDTRLARHPYISAYATIVSETPGGQVQVYLYVVGTEKRLVPRDAVFVRDSAWCRNEAVASVCHSRVHLWGMVYKERREYIRFYPLPVTAKPEDDEGLTEGDVLADFSRSPELFQEVKPHTAFRKEVRIVASSGPVHSIQAEVFLRRDGCDYYSGGYLPERGKEPGEAETPRSVTADEQYVSTFLVRSTLFFAVREDVDVFFVDKEFPGSLTGDKERNYYLIHAGKLYELYQHWEEQVWAYLRGQMTFDDLTRYALEVFNSQAK